MKNDFLTFDDARQLAGPTAFGTMLKPVGASCNLRCNYCYYLDKQDFYPGQLPMMDESLLERYIRQYIQANEVDTVTFCWHGGEWCRLFQEYGVEFNTLSFIRHGCEDLGYGDVGCYGQSLIRTPELDRMAQQGMRFTQAYAGSPVSAPSRATLMTGQHTHSNDFKVTLP